jgi:hypothetical protein
MNEIVDIEYVKIEDLIPGEYYRLELDLSKATFRMTWVTAYDGVVAEFLGDVRDESRYSSSMSEAVKHLNTIYPYEFRVVLGAAHFSIGRTKFKKNIGDKFRFSVHDEFLFRKL